MRISAINNVQQKQPQFKSTIPVYHWVAEKGGSYAPITDKVINKTLQKKIVSMFNGVIHKTRPEMNSLVKRAMSYLRSVDVYYGTLLKYVQNSGNKRTLTRSYYNRDGGWRYNEEFEAISYLITGSDVREFEDKFGKCIGEIKKYDPKTDGERRSADLKLAMHRYNYEGLEFVKDRRKQIRNEAGVPYGLHTKYEIVRDSDGKVVDYRFVDMKFLPEFGAENPFERLSGRKK